MNELYSYLIQSGITASVLFAIYWIFLRNDTFYSTNRYYLVFSLLISTIVPLIKIPIEGTSGGFHMQVLEPVVITPGIVAAGIEQNFPWGNLMLMGYLSVSGFLLARMGYQFIRIGLLVRRYGITEYKGLRLVLVDEAYAPFSIFNLIVIRKETLQSPSADKILEHELAHIRQGHTFDLMIFELVRVVHWINPIVWFYKRSLVSTHEYLADSQVLARGTSSVEYQQLLMHQTFGVQYIVLSNNLNHSLIKKRFIMMTKEKTKKIKLLKMLLIVPAALAISFVFSLTLADTVAAKSNAPSGYEVNPVNGNLKILQEEDPVFTVVEVMPQFPGGQDALIKYLSEHIKYPEAARKNGIQGTVYVTYVVEKSGKITSTRVLRGVDTELDKEAVRVVSTMPNWKPGKEKGKPVRVQFTLPISYKLDSGDSDKKEKEKSKNPREYPDVKKIDK